MPLPVIGGITRCAFNWTTGSGQTATNVMHFAASAADLTDLMAALQASFNQPMIAVCSAEAVIHTVDMTPLDGVTATQGFTFSPDKFSTTGGQYSPATSALVKLQTAIRGRNTNGRVFLPFVLELEMDRGFVVAGDMANWQTGWDTFIADMVTAGFPLNVASYTNASSQVVTSALCEPALATQRRRQSRLR